MSSRVGAGSSHSFQVLSPTAPRKHCASEELSPPSADLWNRICQSIELKRTIESLRGKIWKDDQERLTLALKKLEVLEKAGLGVSKKEFHQRIQENKTGCDLKPVDYQLQLKKAAWYRESLSGTFTKTPASSRLNPPSSDLAILERRLKNPQEEGMALGISILQQKQKEMWLEPHAKEWLATLKLVKKYQPKALEEEARESQFSAFLQAAGSRVTPVVNWYFETLPALKKPETWIGIFKSIPPSKEDEKLSQVFSVFKRSGIPWKSLWNTCHEDPQLVQFCNGLKNKAVQWGGASVQ